MIFQDHARQWWNFRLSCNNHSENNKLYLCIDFKYEQPLRYSSSVYLTSIHEERLSHSQTEIDTGAQAASFTT